jgi:hypothetical protein
MSTAGNSEKVVKSFKQELKKRRKTPSKWGEFGAFSPQAIEAASKPFRN